MKYIIIIHRSFHILLCYWVKTTTNDVRIMFINVYATSLILIFSVLKCLVLPNDKLQVLYLLKIKKKKNLLIIHFLYSTFLTIL